MYKKIIFSTSKNDSFKEVIQPSKTWLTIRKTKVVMWSKYFEKKSCKLLKKTGRT